MKQRKVVAIPVPLQKIYEIMFTSTLKETGSPVVTIWTLPIDMFN